MVLPLLEESEIFTVNSSTIGPSKFGDHKMVIELNLPLVKVLSTCLLLLVVLSWMEKLLFKNGRLALKDITWKTLP